MNDLNLSMCSACAACVNVCPNDCLVLKHDARGFLSPEINTDFCCHCNQCQEVCPIEKDWFFKKNMGCYSLYDNRENKRLESTSGGAFGLLAESVINKNGVVYGCTLNDNLQVEHIRIDDEKKISLLKGSKYVQSNIGHTFMLAKQDIKEDKLVLFSGTPCQIAGLYSFLGRDYPNLITIDLICHGVSSQSYFDKYIEYLTKKYKAPIKDCNFRDKTVKGWSLAGSISYKKNEELVKKPLYYFSSFYYYYFLNSKTYRDSCYSCKYARLDRVGDISVGDFWGSERYMNYKEARNGVSLVMTNSEKGLMLLQSLDMSKKSIKLEDITKYNQQLTQPSKMPIDRNQIIEEGCLKSGDYIQRNFIRNNWVTIVVCVLKNLIPNSCKYYIREVFRGKFRKKQ